jgi:hypothetical protein
VSGGWFGNGPPLGECPDPGCAGLCVLHTATGTPTAKKIPQTISRAITLASILLDSTEHEHGQCFKAYCKNTGGCQPPPLMPVHEPDAESDQLADRNRVEHIGNVFPLLVVHFGESLKPSGEPPRVPTGILERHRDAAMTEIILNAAQ